MVVSEFANLGRLYLGSFAEPISITDRSTLSDLLELLESEVGNLERVYEVTLDDSDTFRGKAEQRISIGRSQTYSFTINPTRISYRLTDADRVLMYMATDVGFAEVLEYAAKTAKGAKTNKAQRKLNCKPGNIQCGGKCQNGSLNCFKNMNPEQAAIAKRAARKARAAAKKAGLASGQIAGNAERDSVRDEFLPFYDMAASSLNPDDIKLDPEGVKAARAIMEPAYNSVAKAERIKELNPQLTSDEAAGLAEWLGVKGCSTMNKRLYAPDLPDPNNQVLTLNLLAAKALHKIPPVTDVEAASFLESTFAESLGSNFDASKPLRKHLRFKSQEDLDSYVNSFRAKVGQEYREPTFLGVTHDESKISWITDDSQVILEITPKLDGTGSGRYVDHYKNKTVEAEILYPPQSKFRVTGVRTTSKTSTPEPFEKALLEEYDYIKAMQSNFPGKWQSVYTQVYGKPAPSQSDFTELQAEVDIIRSKLGFDNRTIIQLEET